MLVPLQHLIKYTQCSASPNAPITAPASLQLAARFGTDAIKLDAKLIAVGEVVVFHDATREYAANGSGRRLHSWTLDAPEDIKLHIARGVEGILTGVPQTVRLSGGRGA